jgi:hypothetical protein
MAARLLISPIPLVHTITDDLESFLHVLSWVALRFARHQLTPKGLTDLLVQVFDNAYVEDDGSPRGGLGKQNFMIARTIKKSGFHHPILPKLFQDLTEVYAVRYDEPPSDADIAEFHRLRAEDPAMAKAMEHYGAKVPEYERKMAALGSSDWMLQRFTEALADVKLWPPGDKSQMNQLSYEPIPGRKRKAEHEFGPVPPRQKLRYSEPDEGGDDDDDVDVDDVDDDVDDDDEDEDEDADERASAGVLGAPGLFNT